MLWCGSTEIFLEPDDVHKTLQGFEQGLKADHPAITPSMIYAYAALQSGVPFGNGAPNLSVDIPALQELAAERGVPICGKDFKTGQTLMKTIIAPGLKARMLGVHGWFSTNILGIATAMCCTILARSAPRNRVSCRCDYILQPDLYEDLYTLRTSGAYTLLQAPRRQQGRLG